MGIDWGRLFFYYHPLFLKHLEGVHHPENPHRLEVILEYLKLRGVWEKVTRIQPVAADLSWVETNHAKTYVDYVRQSCEEPLHTLDGGDTLVTPDSFRAAELAVGAALQAVDALLTGKAAGAFCALRPPGHHAEYDRAMGFCLFNNVAIAARYALEKHGLDRVFILDWDVHHGNGTQHSFESSPEVFYCSLHQWPLFPGTGSSDETGSGAGTGFTMNFPLPAGTGEAEYLRILQEKILPVVRDFKPQLFIISAGFDAHRDDPLAGMELSTTTFGEMTRMVRRELDPLAGVKILSVLEGGYHLTALAESVFEHLRALIEPLQDVAERGPAFV